MIRINFAGFNIKLVPFKGFNTPITFILGLFVTGASIVWKAQIASQAKYNRMNNVDIPALESSRFISGKLLNSSVSKYVYASQAVCSTLEYETKLLDPSIPKEQRMVELHKTITDTVMSTGPAQLFRATGLNRDNLAMYRRGYMASLRGKLQNDSIFNCNSILNLPGKHISKVTLDDYIEVFLELLGHFGIPLKLTYFVFQGNIAENLDPNSFAFQDAQYFDTLPEPKVEQVKQTIKEWWTELVNYISGGNLIFNDEISLFPKNASSYILPFEEGLVGLKRAIPFTLDPKTAKQLQEGDPSDPLIQIAKQSLQDKQDPMKGKRTSRTSRSKKGQPDTPDVGNLF